MALVRPSQWLKYVAGWICTVVRAYIINRRDELEPGESIEQLEKEREVKSPEEIKTDVNQTETGNSENEEDEENEEKISEIEPKGITDSDLEVKEEEIEG